jgi:hypothetical protein
MAEVFYQGPSRLQEEDLPLAFQFESNGQYFEFVPRSVFEKGVAKGDTQYYFPSVLSPGFGESLGSNSQYVEVQSIADQAGNKIKEDLKKSGYDDETGYLFQLSPNERGTFNGWLDSQKLTSYEIGKPLQTEVGFINRGKITGLGSYEGQPVFTYDTAGSSEPIKQGWISYNPETGGGQTAAYYFIPGKENKFAKALGVVGGGLIALGTAGLAGIGPLAAASGGAAGAGAAGGATLATSTAVPGSFQAALPSLGVQTAATTAGATAVPGSFAAAVPGLLTAAPSAPIYFADAVSANELAYPAQEVGQAFTPAPGSFQEALPGLGVETQASAGGFTAAPGSFQAALPSLGIASAPSLAMNLPSQASSLLSTDNLSNALRLGNALMGQPQQQQGLLGGGMGGGRQAGAVDYSGVLGLLAQQARAPGVSSLAAPAQLQPMYQPTLLPNVLSLLG